MSYLGELRKMAAEQQRAATLRKDIDTVERLNKQCELARRTKPLTDQITELLNTLPQQQRNRLWSMADMVARLTGKYRARPHAQQVGMALRQLGWHRERRWEAGYDGARVWSPPRT